MSKLLVSVRSAEEAELALEAGADLIDIKEPLAGSLGAASAAVIAAVLAVVGRRAPVSVACGELLQSAVEVARRLPRGNEKAGRPSAAVRLSPLSQPLPLRGEELRNAPDAASRAPVCSPDYVKAGLAGCGSIGDWQQRWRQFIAEIPQASVAVAVIYADWRAADAPPPEAVLEQACAVERAAILVDTFDKSGPGLLRLCKRGEIQAWIDAGHAAGTIVAVGGQLSVDDARAVAELRPDYIAVRGAVCKPDRVGDLDREQILHLKRCIGREVHDAFSGRAT